MVTVITINNKDFVLKPENISNMFKAMNREQIDLFFANYKDEDYSHTIYSRIIGNGSYLVAISKTFEKLSGLGIVKFKKMHECAHCNKLIEITEANSVGTRRGVSYFCSECLEEFTENCPTCGHRRLKTEVMVIVNDDKTLTSCCYDGTRNMGGVRSCQHCHRLYHGDPYWGYSNGLCPICQEYFEICDNCGRAAERGSLEHGMCKACIKSRKVRDAIKSYSYKPDPNFIRTEGEEPPAEYMGLEWEMELIADSTYKRRKVKAVDNEEWVESQRNNFFAYELGELSKGWAYCKSDGSLDYGVEFVTHPITLKAWEQDYYSKLCAIKECMKAWGCRTKASTAGIHIHFSRGQLSGTIIKRICWLLSQSDNYEFMRKFCHRNKDNMTHWAKRHSNWSAKLSDFYCDTDNRYRIVNLCNSNTIEFRCFGYTTDVDEIMIYLYAVDSIVNYCRDHTNTEVEKANMVEVLTYRNTEKMTEYLEKRSDLEKCV